MPKQIAVYPGSFDPVTLGHEDIIRRAAGLFDRVIVAVLHNPAKKGCFPIHDRLHMLTQITADLPNVSIAQWDGMLVDFLRYTGAKVVIRGLRQVSDFESEMTMSQVNGKLLPGMETVFFMTRPEHGCISSSVVREVASFGGDITSFVSETIAVEIVKHFSHNSERQL